MKILSFGGGVQTVTLAAMASLDEIERPDFAVFADTQWESRATYAYLHWFTRWAKERGLDIIHVTGGNIRDDALNVGKGFASMPLWTKGKGGSMVPLRRQCTREYKITVVQRAIRLKAGLNHGQRWKGDPCEVWLGISLEEVMRMKESLDKWVRIRWPLIERRMTRGDCVEWLRRRAIQVPPKSACIGCPYHSDDFWRSLKRDNPAEWEDACSFDEAIRHARVSIRTPAFLHRSGLPLREVPLDQTGSLFGEECAGFCGT